jgi:hypothetical protein
MQTIQRNFLDADKHWRAKRYRRTTSQRRQSAAGLASLNVPSLQDRVAAELRRAGDRGLTDEELFAAFIERGEARKESSLRARRVELVNAGQVVDSGRTRKTRCNVEAVVWKWTDAPCLTAGALSSKGSSGLDAAPPTPEPPRGA